MLQVRVLRKCAFFLIWLFATFYSMPEAEAFSFGFNYYRGLSPQVIGWQTYIRGYQPVYGVRPVYGYPQYRGGYPGGYNPYQRPRYSVSGGRRYSYRSGGGRSRRRSRSSGRRRRGSSSRPSSTSSSSRPSAGPPAASGPTQIIDDSQRSFVPLIDCSGQGNCNFFLNFWRRVTNFNQQPLEVEGKILVCATTCNDDGTASFEVEGECTENDEALHRANLICDEEMNQHSEAEVPCLSYSCSEANAVTEENLKVLKTTIDIAQITCDDYFEGIQCNCSEDNPDPFPNLNQTQQREYTEYLKDIKKKGGQKNLVECVLAYQKSSLGLSTGQCNPDCEVSETACLGENSVNTNGIKYCRSIGQTFKIVNTMKELSDCLNIDENLMANVLGHESGFHINAIASGGDTSVGIGQIKVAGNGRSAYGQVVKDKYKYLKDHRIQDHKQCKQIVNSALARMNDKKMTNMCHLIHPQDNPPMSLVAAYLYMDYGKKIVESYLKDNTSCSSYKVNYSIVANKLLDDEKIMNRLIATGYNAGFGRVKSYICDYFWTLFASEGAKNGTSSNKDNAHQRYARENGLDLTKTSGRENDRKQVEVRDEDFREQDFEPGGDFFNPKITTINDIGGESYVDRAHGDIKGKVAEKCEKKL